MKKIENKLMYAAAKEDFYTFVQKTFQLVDNSQEFIRNWHIELICDKLQQCANGNIKRLIINIPPRYLKSFCASTAFTAWLLGHKPTSRILCVSYSEELANKFSRDCKKIMQSNFYKKTFSTKLSKDKQTENFIETTQNGYRYATSTNATLTGFGGNFIIIDDPMKAIDCYSQRKLNKINNWFNNTLISRLNNKKDGVIILIMQRLHLNDLTGHLLKQGGWETLVLPAIAEKDEKYILSNNKIITRKCGEALNRNLETVDMLKIQRSVMNEFDFEAQYQQNPIPEEGKIIELKNIQTYETLPLVARDDYIIQSWDVAMCTNENNDYSVGITALFKNGCLYIKDVYRNKLKPTELVKKIIELIVTHHGTVLLIEDTVSTKHLIDELKQRHIKPIEFKPQGDKVLRASNSTFFINANRLYFPKEAPWLDALKSEIVQFPNGKHDDQIDALTQLILCASKPQEKTQAEKQLELMDLLLKDKYGASAKELRALRKSRWLRWN